MILKNKVQQLVQKLPMLSRNLEVSLISNVLGLMLNKNRKGINQEVDVLRRMRNMKFQRHNFELVPNSENTNFY